MNASGVSLCRYRVFFGKTEAMRYTGHLDLFRTWERTIRRAGLPLAYSAGFRPHPRLNLAAALPLGLTSECEVLDIWLDRELATNEISERLQQALPQGIELHQVEAIELRAPALQRQVLAAEYLITLLEGVPDLDARIAKILEAEHLLRDRRGRAYDLRPLILELTRLPDAPSGNARILVRLAAREGATGRPEEVVRALGGKPERARFHRLKLIFSSQPEI